MVITKLTKNQISKTVKTSSAIEGYSQPEKIVIAKAKELMNKYHVKVSPKK